MRPQACVEDVEAAALSSRTQPAVRVSSLNLNLRSGVYIPEPPKPPKPQPKTFMLCTVKPCTVTAESRATAQVPRSVVRLKATSRPHSD